jgi:hypothetical protein
MKLTKPQIQTLRQLAKDFSGASTLYKPAMKLVALGLAEVRIGRFTDRVQITEAGREFLKEKP